MISFFDAFEGNNTLLLLNILLQITLLSAAAIILSRRYKNSAATRYGILFPALVSMVLLAVMSIFLQSKNTSLLYFPLNIQQSPITSVTSEFNFSEFSMLDIEFESGVSELANAGAGALSGMPEINTLSTWELFSSVPSYLVLMVVWVAGLFFSTFGLLRGLHNMEQVKRCSFQASRAEKQRLDKLLRQVLPDANRVPFRISTQISSPMLTGLIQPVILLPENLVASLNEAQLKSVLLHELAHFERKDLLANFVQRVLVSIFWFHPLVHVMDGMISRAREEICDNYVLARQRPLDYGETLLQLSALVSSSDNEDVDKSLSLAMFGGEWKLEQRIGELLNERREKSMKLNRRTTWALRSLLISFSLLLAACQLGVKSSAGVYANAGSETVSAANETNKQQALAEKSSASKKQSEQQELPSREEERTMQQATSRSALQPGTAVYIQTQTQSQAQLNPAPAARTVGSLGPRVKEAITQVQEYMQPTDEADEADMLAAKELLDRLYNERFEAMNDFEKSTTLSFYTNYYLASDNYPEAILSFEQTLEIETLQDDVRLRALRSLGQLYAAVENWGESIRFYQQWSEVSIEDDELTFRGLSYAYYQLEQFSDALPSWLGYMDLVRSGDGELDRDDYSYLNGLYFSLEDFDSALGLTKEMILLFNNPKDWESLRIIYQKLDSGVEADQVGRAV